MLISCSPGLEAWLPYAKKELDKLDQRRQREDVPVLRKSIFPVPGVQIQLSSGFGGKIRISPAGSGLVPSDPFFPLWNSAAALAPRTRDGVTPALRVTAAETVQHVFAYYPDEEADGAYIRRHWLVVVRYCKRVAEYTWDEVVTPGPEGTTTTIGEYVSHTATGDSLVLRDTVEGVQTLRTVPISPSLIELSEANPWGWIETAGPSAMHPGEQPPNPDIPYYHASTTPGGYFAPYGGDPYIAWHMAFYGSNGAPFFVQFAIIVLQLHVEMTNGVGPETRLTLQGGSFQGLTWQFDYTIYAIGEQYGVAITSTPLGPLPHGGEPMYGAVPVGTHPDPYPAWNAEINSHLTSLNAGVDEENIVRQAALEEWRQRCVECAKYIVDQARAMMAEKLYTATDLTELRPHLTETTTARALVVPVYSSANMTFTRPPEAYVAVAATATYDMVSPHPSVMLLAATSIYGVTGAKTAGEPYEPWIVRAETPLSFDYSPATFAFTPTAEPKVMVNAYYSRTTTPPLEFARRATAHGAGQSPAAIGFYKIAGPAAYTAQELAFPPKEAGGIPAFSKRLCTGGEGTDDLFNAEIQYCVFYALQDGTARLATIKTYRVDEHTHTNAVSGLVFAQPAIPLT